MGPEDILSLSEYLYRRNLILSYLEEDVGFCDITSEALIPIDTSANAEVWCKCSAENVVICGLEEACMALELCGCYPRKLVDDGAIATGAQQVITVQGNARAILKAERTALNLLMRMSGVATETRKYSLHLRKLGVNTLVTGTRKTSPGMRAFDKKAIAIGGGYTHRMGLYDKVLIKDNHVAILGSATECVNMARNRFGGDKEIECEVRTVEELIPVVLAGVDIVMLDNFSVDSAKAAISILRELGLRNRVLVEISGGISESNFQDFARLDPDFISIGSITHSTRAVDFSLAIKTNFTKLG